MATKKQTRTNYQGERNVFILKPKKGDQKKNSPAMAAAKGKLLLIPLSFSSDGADECETCSTSSSSASECDDDDDDEVDIYEVDDSDEDDDESFDNGAQSTGDDDDDDENAVYNRVVHYLQEKRDLRELSLNSCKAYLRRLGLRVTGNKEECVKRVQEHWRIKDGEAENIYPRPSFAINCTGDVCKGDVILFTQKVYSSFDKVTRGGKLMGKRTVAGRVVKESYGAAKQQHTFTVEVLWSKGIKKLPSLSPLLVKGRNLYRLKTYRQPWRNEAQRRKVLDEKHKRGMVARLKREKRKRAWSSDRGGKSKKKIHSAMPSQMSCPKRGKCTDRDDRATSSKHSTTSFSSQQRNVKQGTGAHTIKTSWLKPFTKRKNLIFPEDQVSSFQSYDGSLKHSGPLVGSMSAEFRRVTPGHGPFMMPVEGYGFDGRPLHNYFQSHSLTNGNIWQSFPPESLPGQRRSMFFCCSILGCKESGSYKCVIGACQICCRMRGMRCYGHS